MEVSSESLKIIATAAKIEKWTGEGSPWENFLIERNLKPFSFQDAKELIEKPVQGIINYSNEAVKKIFEYTHGNPYFLQKFCGILIDEAFRKDEVNIKLQDVERIYPKFQKELVKDDLELSNSF